LALEDVEQTLAAADAAAENDTTAQKQATPRRRHINRGALPVHFPREEIVIDVADKTCACCGGLKHRIGEDVSERLDVIPAQFKVIVTRRPKYACQVCAGEVVQAPALERLIRTAFPPRHWSRMCWSPNMPITRRSIVKRKSMHAKASRSIAPPWRTG